LFVAGGWVGRPASALSPVRSMGGEWPWWGNVWSAGSGVTPVRRQLSHLPLTGECPWVTGGLGAGSDVTPSDSPRPAACVGVWGLPRPRGGGEAAGWGSSGVACCCWRCLCCCCRWGPYIPVVRHTHTHTHTRCTVYGWAQVGEPMGPVSALMAGNYHCQPTKNSRQGSAPVRGTVPSPLAPWCAVASGRKSFSGADSRRMVCQSARDARHKRQER